MKALIRRRVQLGLVALLLALALLEHRLGQLWPTLSAPPAVRHLFVTSGDDTGTGSLRAALIGAARADGRALVTIRVPRIEVSSPLPPLVNPDGIEISSDEPAEIVDARAGASAVLVVAARGSVLRGLRIRGPAESACVVVRADNVRIEASELRDCDTGILLEAGAQGLAVDRSQLVENRVGIELPGTRTHAVITGTTFLNNRTAGIWKVAASSAALPEAGDLVVRDCRFRGGRHALVLFHAPALVERNDFRRQAESAILVSSGRVVLRGNRVTAGSVGITALSADGLLIDQNEVDRNEAVGIVLNRTRDAQVRDNILYDNGYGIADALGDARGPNLLSGNLVTTHAHDGIYLAGSSPVVRGNRILANHAAGLRLLEVIPVSGPSRPSEPLLQGNTIADNASDEPARGSLDLSAPRGEGAY